MVAADGSTFLSHHCYWDCQAIICNCDCNVEVGAVVRPSLIPIWAQDVRLALFGTIPC